MKIDERKRKKLIHDLTATLLALLHHGLIDSVEAKDIAKHLLTHNEKMKKNEDIEQFLGELTEKWDLFKFHLEDYLATKDNKSPQL